MKNWQRVKKWFCSNIKYLLLYLMLFTFMFLAWYIFIYSFKFESTALQIGGIIAFLGLGFTLFQFGYNNTTTNKRRLYDLRYSNYKEILLQVDAICDVLNEQLTATKVSEAYGLLTKLTNQIFRFTSTVGENSQHLFVNIADVEEYKIIDSLISKITKRVDSYKESVEHSIRADNNIERNNFLDTVTALQWKKDIHTYLKEIHFNKFNFYRKLREYL